MSTAVDQRHDRRWRTRPDTLRDIWSRLRIPAVLLLAALTQFLFLHPFLLHGGLFIDDWPLAAIHHFRGTWSLLQGLLQGDHERPLADIYLALTAGVSGTSPQLHAFWGFLTHLACLITVVWVAVALGMPRLPALALGLLAMLFPFSDSVWLWYASSHLSLAIAFAGIGVLLALRGLRSSRSWPWHAGAAVLFAASVLTYQVAVVAIALTLAVYWPRTRHSVALKLWAKDVLVAVCAAELPSALTGSRGSYVAPSLPFTPGALLHHAHLMLTQGASVMTDALVPLGDAHREIVLPIAAAIGLAGLVQAWRGRASARAHARTWLGWTAAGLALVTAAYAAFLPASLFYVPLAPGQGNRVNALAGFGFCVTAIALAMLLAGLLTPARLRRWTPWIAILFTVPVMIGYVQRTDADMSAWSKAADIQRRELKVLERIGRPPSGSVDYVGGGIGTSAPGVFAFGWPYDLDSAMQLAWNDDTIHTWPVLAEVPLQCTRTGVRPLGASFGYGAQQVGSYPLVLFTDLRSRRRVTVRRLSECRRAIRNAIPFPPQS